LINPIWDLSLASWVCCPLLSAGGTSGQGSGASLWDSFERREDQEITNYFIQSAFPPEGLVQEVLSALDQADDGFCPYVGAAVESFERQIDKVLKILAVESPAPVTNRKASGMQPSSLSTGSVKIERLTNPSK